MALDGRQLDPGLLLILAILVEGVGVVASNRGRCEVGFVELGLFLESEELLLVAKEFLLLLPHLQRVALQHVLENIDL